MWSAVHEGRVLFFNAPGPAGASAPLPEGAIAVGLGPRGAAVLCADGAVLAIEPDGAVRQNRRIELPPRVGRAAISADGSLIIVSTPDGHESCDVSKEENGRWGLVSTPDFLCAVTDIRCAPDGKTFGYGYRTSQPWSDYGSYGDPLYGAAVFKADGTALREDWDTRRYNEDPEISLAWGDGGDPLVVFMADASNDYAEVLGSWGQPRRGPFDVWEGGRVGAPPLEKEVRLQIVPYLAKELAVSPGGDRVGVLTVWGELFVVDRAGSRRCSAATGVAAIELLDAPLIGWMTEGGVWTRAPASSLAWEIIGAGEFY